MTGGWKAARLRHRAKRPTPALQSIVHRIEGHLAAAPGSALVVVEIGAAESAAIAVTAVAHRLVAEGKRVLLADAARGRPLRVILRGKGVPGTFQTVFLQGQPLDLFLAPADPTLMAGQASDADADVTLVLATIDPAFGAEHLATWASLAVVMVGAGEAPAPRIQSVASQLRHARIPVRSGLLVGTDPNDHSSGVPARRAGAADPVDGLLETLKAAGE